MLDIEPWAYLRDILCLLPRWPSHRLLELAPMNWPRTSDDASVRELLAKNSYRHLTLLDGDS
jgi:transposase